MLHHQDLRVCSDARVTSYDTRHFFKVRLKENLLVKKVYEGSDRKVPRVPEFGL